MIQLSEELSPQDQELAGQEAAARQLVLQSLAFGVAQRRTEAIEGRATSGIEKEWEGDEEFYVGIDDANRHEFAETAQKPTASGATAKPRVRKNQSTIFPNITQPYVDAAAARIGDMLLPTDDRNFALKHTPIPDLAIPQGVEQITLQSGQVVKPTDLAQAIEQIKAEAKKKAESAEKWIDDRLIECQWHAEVRKVIDDCARIGSGVLKGPVPMKRTVKAWITEGGISRLDKKDLIKPGSKRVDPWNFFPDPACGENIHEGSFCFERDFLTEQKVRELKGLPGYIADEIDAVIEEGPTKYRAGGRKIAWDSKSTAKKGQFEVWYYHGQIKAEEMRTALECAGWAPKNEDGTEDDSWRDELDGGESVDVMLTMMNDRVVRASFNPLDSGDLPYDVIPWKRRPNMPWGMGVGRQMRTPQRIVVGASRHLMNNAGLAGPQIILKKGLKPVDGKREVVPLKFWFADEDAEGKPVGDYFKTEVIPMLEGNLMNIVQFGLKMAEDVTGLPMLLQGQQGKAPDTVGGMTILNNNGTAVLRRIARLFDSCITEPHITRYYDWLMAYEEDDSLKGDYLIDARGSSALVERDLQNQEMPQILQMCLNPLFEKSPKRAMDEYLKSRRFDPKMFDLTDEERAEMAKRQPPPDPRIVAAEIMSKTQLAIADMRKGTDEKRIDVQSADNQMDAKVALERIAADIEKAMTGDATTRETSLAQVKKDLAAIAMKLTVQRELAPGSQVAQPAAEPPQRAPNGMAFAQ